MYASHRLGSCAGDASDNIAGVPSIGKKRAMELVQRYSTVENLYVGIHALVRISACTALPS